MAPSQITHPLLTLWADFLLITIHTLLHNRFLYPQSTFATARFLSTPVHQSRHPAVIQWIREAVTAISQEVLSGGVERVIFVIFGKPKVPERTPGDGPSEASRGKEPEGQVDESQEGKKVLERWVFTTTHIPPIDSLPILEEDEEMPEWSSTMDAFRGAIGRIALESSRLPALDATDLTYSLVVEKDDSGTGLQDPPTWIPSDSIPTASQTHPIRTVTADPLFFECWLEK